MRSQTVSSFWTEYQSLPENTKKDARKAYRLWLQNPFHPSLHFKCINYKEHIWSLRISLGYRALGIYEGDTVTWFWIGAIHHMIDFSHSFTPDLLCYDSTPNLPKNVHPVKFTIVTAQRI